MADETDLALEGIPQFDAAMMELAGDGFDRAARKAVRAGGKIIQEAIIEAAPVRKKGLGGDSKNPAWDLPLGALKSDIELHVAKEKDGSFSAYIEHGKFTRFVAAMVEYGHAIYRGRKSKGGYLGKVPEHPFIRPAFDASEGQAEATALETFNEEIAKEAKQLGVG